MALESYTTAALEICCVWCVRKEVGLGLYKIFFDFEACACVCTYQASLYPPPTPPPTYITTLLLGLYTIDITNTVWCMANKRRVVGGSYIAQQARNSIAIVRAMQVVGGNTRVTGSCTTASK